MMGSQDQLLEIAHRKERLIARAEAQRVAVAASFRGLQRPIGMVDSGLAAARFLGGHPLLVAAIVATVTIFRRRGLVAVAGRAFSAWRLVRAVSTWVA